MATIGQPLAASSGGLALSLGAGGAGLWSAGTSREVPLAAGASSVASCLGGKAQVARLNALTVDGHAWCIASNLGSATSSARRAAPDAAGVIVARRLRAVEIAATGRASVVGEVAPRVPVALTALRVGVSAELHVLADATALVELGNPEARRVRVAAWSTSVHSGARGLASASDNSAVGASSAAGGVALGALLDAALAAWSQDDFALRISRTANKVRGAIQARASNLADGAGPVADGTRVANVAIGLLGAGADAGARGDVVQAIVVLLAADAVSGVLLSARL